MQKVSISIIACISTNNVIGIDGDLAFHIKEDFKKFKEITLGHTVIMGRKTYESLPNGALKGRRNIVVTSSDNTYPGCDTAHSLQEALGMSKNDGEVFIIGGESIYRQAMPIADTLYITQVYQTIDYEYGREYSYFPEINESEWEQDVIIFPTSATKSRYSFITYSKRK